MTRARLAWRDGCARWLGVALHLPLLAFGLAVTLVSLLSLGDPGFGHGRWAWIAWITSGLGLLCTGYAVVVIVLLLRIERGPGR